MTDMIIKLHLPQEVLQSLLQTSESAGMTLPELFKKFIDDLTGDSCMLEYWLQVQTMKNLPPLPSNTPGSVEVVSKELQDVRLLVDSILTTASQTC